MPGFKRIFPAVGVAVLSLITSLGSASAVDEVYSPPALEDVRSNILEWVAEQGMKDQDVLTQIGKIWAVKPESRLSAQILFDKTLETFGLVDAETKAFVDSCSLADPSLLPPEAKPLERTDAGDFYTANLRLFYARYLTQRKMYDEALDQFSQVKPESVIDPATCLYHKAVCEHQLLLKDEGLATIKTLLSSTEDVPVRYSTVATLMQHELKGIKEKSLLEVAHLQNDIKRRLDLGRGGQRVQRKEAKVLATLDEIIEKLEQEGGT